MFIKMYTFILKLYHSYFLYLELNSSYSASKKQMFSVCRQFYFSKVTFVALPSKYQRALHHESKQKIEKIKLREPFAVVAGNLPKTALNGEQAFNFLNDGKLPDFNIIVFETRCQSFYSRRRSYTYNTYFGIL